MFTDQRKHYKKWQTRSNSKVRHLYRERFGKRIIFFKILIEQSKNNTKKVGQIMKVIRKEIIYFKIIILILFLKVI